MKNDSQWVLLVRTCTGPISAMRFKNVNAAETAAYIAKIANPDAKVLMQRDPQFGGLVWEGGAWHMLVLKVEGSRPVIKRASDFAAAHREHEMLWQASACGVAFFS